MLPTRRYHSSALFCRLLDFGALAWSASKRLHGIEITRHVNSKLEFKLGLETKRGHEDTPFELLHTC